MSFSLIGGLVEHEHIGEQAGARIERVTPVAQGTDAPPALLTRSLASLGQGGQSQSIVTGATPGSHFPFPKNPLQYFPRGRLR